MTPNRRGFTFIELMMVVVVLGILATLVIPRFSALTSKARLAAVRTDVRNAESAEENYYAAYGSYGSLSQLQSTGTLSLSAGTAMTVAVDSTGYRVDATNSGIAVGPTTCSVQFGMGAAPEVEGTVTCM